MLETEQQNQTDVETNQTEQSETSEQTQTNWLDDFENLSADDRKALSKYTSAQDAISGGLNAMRLIGKSVRIPDDKTPPEERAKFDEKIRAYMGVPASPEDYKFTRPQLPDGVPYDEDAEKWFRTVAYKAKAPQGLVQEIYNAWNERQIAAHQVYQQLTKKAEDALRQEWGQDFEMKLGVPGDPKKIGTVKQSILQMSRLLGLDYTDDAGTPQSKLIDDLELVRPGGCFGDKTSILKVFDWLYNNFFAEGKTFSGEPPKGGEGDFWKELYAKTDDGKDAEQ